MDAGIQLQLLGPVQLVCGGVALKGFESRKALALLCYLAYQPHPVARGALVHLFWGDKPESRGRGNLSRVINNLTSLLPEIVQADRQQVAIQQNAGLWLDAAAFETLTKQPDVISMNAAIDLYRGDFMEDMVLDDCPEFEAWVVAEREYLKQQAAQAFADLIAHHLDRQEYADAIGLAERLLKLNPWREEVHRQLMLLLALSGQRSAGLMQYERCRAILERELEVAPSDDTVQLQRRIESSAAIDPSEAARWMPAARRLLEHGLHLPAPSAPLLGREKELAGLCQQLQAPDCRLLSVVGPGGVGKTRLAVEVAHQLAARFPQGVNFVSLEPLGAVGLLVPLLADAFKLSFHRGDDPKTRLLDYLRGKELLLVVDGFEHLIEGAGVLAELIAQTQKLKVLVTSRRPLKLKEERTFLLQGLPIPTPTDGAGHNSALALFEQSAKRGNPSFAIADQERGDAVRICGLVEGLPLALELAAASTRALTCREIADEIERNIDVLANPMQDAPLQHHSMRATFEHSWRMLDEAEQEVFLQVSVFRGGFDRAAFEAVTGANVHALGALLDQSLVWKGAGLFQVHELLRQLALERLQDDPQRFEAVQAAHCRHYAEVARDCRARLRGGDQLAALAQLGAVLENVRAAWRAAVALGLEEPLELMLEPLSRFFDLRSRYQEGAALFGETLRALKQAKRSDGVVYARVLIRQGIFLLHQADYDRSQRALEQGATLLETHNAPRDSAQALNALGEVWYAKGHDQEAQRCLEQSLKRFEALGDAAGMATVQNNLGNLAWRQGAYPEAQRLHQAALALRRREGDDWGTASSLNNLGAVAYHQKDYDDARQYFEEGLKIAQRIDHPLEVAACLNNLGEVARQQGDLEAAKTHHTASKRLRETIGNRIGVAYSNNNLGDVLLAMGQLKEAYQRYRQAIRQAMDVDATPAVIYMLTGVARWHAAQQGWERVAQLVGFIQATAHAQDVKNRVEQLLADLESDVETKTLNTWLVQGQTRTLQDWVDEL